MKVKEYFLQLSIVILGILIAFWVSNLGSDYKDKSTQNQVLNTILNELIDNNESINTTLKSLDTLNTIYTRMQEKNTITENFTINYVGLGLTSVGYEIAKYTGILKDLDYELTSKIVGNYESQNSLQEAESLMVNELFKLVKNKSNHGYEIDYLLLQIMNLSNHIKSFDVSQKELIKVLTVSLTPES